MDRQQFREQITHRYVTGKALEGASTDEIAKGIVDPVEQMNYVTGLSRSASNAGGSQDIAGNILGGLFFIAMIVLALFSLVLKFL